MEKSRKKIFTRT